MGAIYKSICMCMCMCIYIYIYIYFHSHKLWDIPCSLGRHIILLFGKHGLVVGRWDKAEARGHVKRPHACAP